MSDPLPLKPAAPPSPAPPPAVEDSSALALSDALQSSFLLVKIMMWIMAVAFLGSGFFTVKDGEKAIILRFGKPVGEGEQALLGPGAHWAFPAPIDRVETVSLGKREEASAVVGLPANPNGVGLEDPPAYPKSTLNPKFDGYAITADTNILHVSARLYYKVTDPVSYLFNFAQSRALVTNILNNAVLYAASRFTVDQILNNRSAFRECVDQRVVSLIEEQRLGIAVDQMTATPYVPGHSKGLFEQVLLETDANDKKANTAISYSNQIISRALAEAHSLTNAAQAESEAYVGLAREEAAQFNKVLPKYQADSNLYMSLRLAQTMGHVLTNAVETKFVSRRADGKPVELRILLGREPREYMPAQTNDN